MEWTTLGSKKKQKKSTHIHAMVFGPWEGASLGEQK